MVSVVIERLKFGMPRSVLLFTVVTLVAFFVQERLWFGMDYTDSRIWEPAAETFAHTGLLSTDDPAYGYPGTTILYATTPLLLRGSSAHFAVTIVMLSLTSILIGILAVLLYILVPHIPAWLLASQLLIFTRMWSDGTPPSTIVGILWGILPLLVLWVRQNETTGRAMTLGVVLGAALATRFETSLVLTALLLPLLIFYVPRRWWLVLCAAAVSFVVLNPYLLFTPVEYLSATYHKVLLHFEHNTARPGLREFMRVAPFSIPAFGIACALLIRRSSVLPRPFLLWCVLSTLAFAALLFSSSYHPVWYFYPLIVLWNVVLSVELTGILTRLRLKGYGESLQALVIGLLLGYQLYLFFSLTT